MENDSSIIFVLILIFLLCIQIFALIAIKKLFNSLTLLVKELRNTRKRITYQNLTKEIISKNTFKTCQNCVFRQTFIEELKPTEEAFFYRCKITNTDIQLSDSCTNFQVESSTSNTK